MNQLHVHPLNIFFKILFLYRPMLRALKDLTGRPGLDSIGSDKK